MKKMKKVLALVLAIGLTLSLAACGGSADKGDAEKSSGELKTVQDGKLIVGMECGYPPFNWSQVDDSNGAVKVENDKSYANGYDVQMAKKLADALGLQLVVKKMAWDGLIPAVNSGDIDLVMAGMSPTPERQKVVGFTSPYYNSQLVVIVRKDGPYAQAKTLEDFKGAKVTGQLGTFHYTVVDQLVGAEKLQAMDDFGAMRAALDSGAIDAYISEKPEALSATRVFKNFTTIEFPADKGFEASKDDLAIAAAIKKDNEALKTKADEVFNKVSDEERAELMEKVIAFQKEEQ